MKLTPKNIAKKKDQNSEIYKRTEKNGEGKDSKANVGKRDVAYFTYLAPRSVSPLEKTIK